VCLLLTKTYMDVGKPELIRQIAALFFPLEYLTNGLLIDSESANF